MKKLLLAFLVVALSLCMLTGCDPDAEEIDWINIKLGHVLPEPQSKLMDVKTNAEDELLVYVHKITENQYLEYQRWCENDWGYTIEKSFLGTNFDAYNSEGYYLSLSFTDHGYNQEMHISLRAPIPMEEYELPEFAIAAGLPIPESKMGHFNWQNENSFSLYVGETVQDAYMLYKDACVAAGFTIDPYEYDTVYSATNAEGYKVSLNYKGFNTFTLEFNGPASESDDNTGSDAEEYAIDYTDVASFEAALNSGTKVNGKIVKFDVVAYKPDSALGINCWSGEHLNFISKNKLDVVAGDIIVGYITQEPTKALGSWEIHYEPLAINDEETDATIPSKPEETTTPETTEPETVKITMSADASSYVGKNYSDVKSELSNLGFTKITVVEKATTDTSHTDGTVESVIVDGSGFATGDIFSQDVAISITYWKVEKPVSEYELAFVRKLSGYSLYYMFDTDAKTVVQFGTDDTYLYKGKYTGSFSSGVTMTWDHGEWTDKFKYTEGSSKATYYDGYGYDWEYTTCDLKTAQDLLDTRER